MSSSSLPAPSSPPSSSVPYSSLSSVQSAVAAWLGHDQGDDSQEDEYNNIEQRPARLGVGAVSASSGLSSIAPHLRHRLVTAKRANQDEPNKQTDMELAKGRHIAMTENRIDAFRSKKKAKTLADVMGKFYVGHEEETGEKREQGGEEKKKKKKKKKKADKEEKEDGPAASSVSAPAVPPSLPSSTHAAPAAPAAATQPTAQNANKKKNSPAAPSRPPASATTPSPAPASSSSNSAYARIAATIDHVQRPIVEKEKKKKRRSKQKNIKKDNRPDHLKPNYQGKEGGQVAKQAKDESSGED